MYLSQYILRNDLFTFVLLRGVVGWWDGAGRGVLLNWIIVGQGPTALAVGAGGGCLVIFFSHLIISLFFLPLSGRRPTID